MEHMAEASNGMLNKVCTPVRLYHKVDSILEPELGCDWAKLILRNCLNKFKFDNVAISLMLIDLLI